MTMPLSFRFPPARAVVLALLLAALLSAFLLADSVPALGSGGVDLEAVELPPLRYPNLGSRLSWMAQDVEDGTATEADAAARAVESDGTSVGVRIVFSAGQEALRNFLSEVGGSVDYVSGNSMKAWVPVAELGRLSRLPITVEVRESVPPQPAGPPSMGSVKSQGVRLHGADVWHQQGYTGFVGVKDPDASNQARVKVGVLDVGFTGYADLVRSGELRPPAGIYCGSVKKPSVSDPSPPTLDDLSACDPGPAYEHGVHGTATAETISDLAPDASLYISNMGYELSADWFRYIGADVVNASVGFHTFDSAPTSLIGYAKTSVRSFTSPSSGSGGLWVNSAGNSSSGASWFSSGPFPDSDNDGYIEFEIGVESNVVTLYDSSPVGLRWDPSWAGSNADVGLYVHDGSGLISTDMSVYGPASGSWRNSKLYCLSYPCDLQIGVRISGVSPPPDWFQVRVSHLDARLRLSDPLGSVIDPAEMNTPGFLAVGASHYWEVGVSVAPYSSRGPVPGATYRKPDLVGVSCARSNSYPSSYGWGGLCWYGGTSNASPHVAGLAALVMGRNPTWTNVQVTQYLTDHSFHPRGLDADDVWGHGFVKLPSDFAARGSYSVHPGSGARGRDVSVLPPIGSTEPFKVCFDLTGSDCVTDSNGDDVVAVGRSGMQFPPGGVPGSGDVTMYVYEQVTAPSLPTAVGAVARPEGKIGGYWSAPVSDGGAPVTRYEYSVDGGGSYTSAGLNTDATVPIYESSVTFHVRACNPVGCGPYGVAAPVAVVPVHPVAAPASAPASVTVTSVGGKVTASWPVVADATKYHVSFTRNNKATWHAPSSGSSSYRGNVITFDTESDGAGATGDVIVSVRAGNSIGWFDVWTESGGIPVTDSGPVQPYVPPDPRDSTRVLTYEVVPSCTLTPLSGDIGDSFSVACTDVDDAHGYFVMDGTTELSRGRSSRGNARFDLTAGSPNSGNSYSFTLEYGENRARRLDLSFAFSMGCTVSRTDGALDGHGAGVLYREDSFNLVCTGLPEGAEYEVHGGTGRSVYRGISHLAVGGRALDGVISHTINPKPPFTERLRGGPLYYELEVRPKYGGFSTLRAGVMVLPAGKVTPSSAAPGEPFLFEVMDMLAVGAVYVRNEVTGERSNVACYGTSGVRGRAGRDGAASLDLLLSQGLEPGDYEMEAYSLNFVSGSGEKCVDFDALPGAPYNLVVARVDFFVDWLKMQISPNTLVRGQQATASGYGFSQLESGQEVTGFHFFGEGGSPCPPPAAPPWDPDYYKGLLCWASGIALDLASVDVDYSGFYSMEFVVPLDVPAPVVVPELGGGVYALNAVSHDGAESLGGFVLLEPKLALSESSSRRGLKITVNGTGFPARRPVTLHHGEGGCPGYSGAPMSAVAGHVLSGADGSFSVEIEVPREPAVGEYRYGDFLVTAVSGPYDGPQFKGVVACGSVEHSVPFPQVTLRPSPASPGIPLRIEGEFFQPYTAVDSVEVLSYTLSGSNARVDGEGRFVVDTTLPDILAVGVYPLRVRLSDGTFIGFRIRVAKPGEIGVDADLMFRDFGDVLEDVWVYDFDTGAWVDLGLGQEGSSSSLLPGDLVALSLSGAATYKGESYGPGLHILFVESY